jgi:hypothetical protein
MSIQLAANLTTLGYGLKDEDLDEIISMDKLRDISSRYSQALSYIQKRFDTKTRIRILEFDRLSGVDHNGQAWYNALIDANRHLFYSTVHSNKNCCTIFLYGSFRGRSKELQNLSLPHEFAHHYQWQTEHFPLIVPRGCPKELLPQFADCCEVGPGKGEVYIDGLLLDEDSVDTFHDFNERASDYICERLLRQKGFTKGILDKYKSGIIADPASKDQAPYLSELGRRYVRRLALYDSAERDDMFTSLFPDNQDVTDILRKERDRVIRLNTVSATAEAAYDAIVDMLRGTDYLSLKNVPTLVSFIKSTMKLLDIEIRTREPW